MPQLRSYTGFAGTPATGAAYNEGTQIGVQAYDASQELQIKRAQLAQQAQQAAMEHSARMEALQQEANIKSQELAVQKAYQTSLLGLKDRELQTDQAKVDFAASQAAQQFGAQESMRREVENAIASGVPRAEAFSTASAKYGLEGGMNGAALANIAGGESGGSFGVPTAMDLMDQSGKPTGTQIAQVSPNRYAFIPKEASPKETSVVPQSEGRLLQWGGKTFENPVWADVKALEKKRDAIDKRVSSTDWYDQRRAFEKSQTGAELTKTQKVRLDEYLKQQEVRDNIDSQIGALKAKLTPDQGASATLPSGMVSPSTNSITIKSIRQTKGR